MRKWVWGVISLAWLLLLALPHENADTDSWFVPGSSNASGPRGSRALYLLLQDVGLQTERWRQPSYAALQPPCVLWRLSRQPLGRIARQALLDFIRRGGTLVAPPAVLQPVWQAAGLGTATLQTHWNVGDTRWHLTLQTPDDVTSMSLGTPPDEYYAGDANAPIVAAWNLGQGRIVALGSDRAAENGSIGKADNGVFLARLAFALGTRHVFDEFGAGLGDTDMLSLMGRLPYRGVFWQAGILAGVGLIALASRRLPAIPAAAIRRRQSRDHIEAVAQLWEQGGDPGLPLHTFLLALDDAARQRMLGGGGSEPFVAWVTARLPEHAGRAAQLWQEAQALCRLVRPPLASTVRLAAQLKELEMETHLW